MSDKTPTAATEAQTNLWSELRKPFPTEVIGKLPRGNVTLDFVGHAAVTDRLNNVVGPDNWNWEPLAYDDYGLPRLDSKGNLWIKLTVAGVTRLGYGDGSSSVKELIGDALRNAAMRFGIALDLWTKDELESTLADPSMKNERGMAAAPKAATQPAPTQTTAAPTRDPQQVSVAQIRAMYGNLKSKGITDGEEARQILHTLAGVESLNDLTKAEAAAILNDLVNPETTKAELLSLIFNEDGQS